MLSSFPSEVEGLNRGGYYPVVSTATGAVRVLYGVSKFAVSAIMTMSVVCGSEDPKKKTRTAALIDHGAYSMADGIAHIFRGCIEIVPIVGNVLIYGYDKSQNGPRKF